MGKVVFSHYNPRMKRVELILELDNEKATPIVKRLEDGDLPSVSMGCFTAQTPVVIEDMSKKPISEIEVGDKVLTHTGSIGEVTELHPRDYSGTMYTINPVGTHREPIESTKEHPWLVIEPTTFFTKDEQSRLVRNKNISLDEAVWKMSEELTGEELLVWPKPQVKNEVACSTEKAKLLGWYLAEGHTHTNDNGVEFSVHKDDQLVSEIEKVAKDYSDLTVSMRTRAHSDSSLSVTIYNKDLKELTLKYCGKYSNKKHLHKDIFSWSEEAKLVFLGAYISGDGFFHDGQAYISSCNKQLLEQIQWLALSINMKSTLGVNNHKAGKGFSSEDTTEHILRFFGDQNSRLATYCNKVKPIDKQSQSGKGGPYEYESFMLVKIDHIESQSYNGPVYNFEVEKDNSYVVNNWAVHNCRVPYDCCSVCGNKAKTLKQYCDHLKYRMNEVLPSGQKIYAINTMPKFFDLSVVTIPADRTAGFLTKVASVEETRVVSSAERAEMLKKEGNMINTAELENTATIKKEVSAEIENIESDPKLLIYNSQPRFDKEKLEKLSSYPLNDVLSTFLGLRIIPKKEDFQKLALYSLGKKDLADKLEKEGTCFEVSSDVKAVIPDDLSLDNFSEKIAGLLEEDVPYMSMTKQLVTARVLTKLAQGTDSNFNAFSKYPGAERGHDRSLLAKLLFSQKEEPKLTPHKNPIIPMGILGGLYVGYLKIAGKFAMSPSKSGFKAFLTTHPWLMPLMVGAGALGTMAFQDHLFTKTAGSVSKFLELSLFAVPASYTYSFMQENKSRKGVPISEFQNFVRKHPFLSAMAATSGGV